MLHTSTRRKLVAWPVSREEVALIAVTMVWGATFLAVQRGLEASGPLFFVGARFGVAALATLALSLRLMRGLERRELLAGAAIGATISAGHALQAFGLQTITSSQSALERKSGSPRRETKNSSTVW